MEFAPFSSRWCGFHLFSPRSIWTHPLSFSVAPLISPSLHIAPLTHHAFRDSRQSKTPDSQAFLPHVLVFLCPPGAESYSQHTSANHPHRGAPWAPRSPFQAYPAFPSSEAAVLESCFPCIHSPAILPPGAQARTYNDLAFLSTTSQGL